MTMLIHKMADYRRQLSKYEQKELLDKYKKHRDAEGGIFTSDKRRKLLGIKGESKKQIHEDSADFWYDVRKTVKNGLKDMELICDVAHPDQLKEMFIETLFKEEKDELAKIINIEEKIRFFKRIPSLEKALNALFKDYIVNHYVIDKHTGQKYTQSDIIGDDSWKAYLGYHTVITCMKFFKGHNFISTKAHERLVEEVEDMLNVEVARGTKLKINERVKGFV